MREGQDATPLAEQVKHVNRAPGGQHALSGDERATLRR